MNKRPIRTAALAGVAFFTTLGILSVWYSAYSSLASVTAGDGLTAAAWTQVKNNFDELNSKVSSFSFNGTNVGVGTPLPTAKLDVTGTLKIADGTQAEGRILTSDANGLASWTEPWYQTATSSLPAGTTVNIGNDVLNSPDVTLTPGIWKLDMGYYLYPSSTSGCFDVHVDSVVTSGTVTSIMAMPNFNSEWAYAPGRHGYLMTTQLVRVTWGNAQVHARRYWSWCGGANYVVGNATLTMIATKIR